MSGRNYAYLDLAALPAIGAVLLSARPVLLWAADGRSLLWANAAGAGFFGEREMASLLERRFSPALPSSEQIARLARNLPVGTRRLERIRFAIGGRLSNLPATCTRLILPDGEDAVLMALESLPSVPASPSECAARLVGLLAADDCMVAILDGEGRAVASSGGLETLVSGEAAVEGLVAAVARQDAPLIKRVIRVDAARRPAGMVRVESEGAVYHLLIVGSAEYAMLEPNPAADTKDEAVVRAEDLSPSQDLQIDGEPLAGEGRPIAAAMPLSEPENKRDEASAIEAAPSKGDDMPARGAAEFPQASSLPTGPVAEAPGETTAPSAFRFVAPVGPTRFVFQMDAEGRFTFVSPDLAAVVGPVSAAIVGSLWRDVAAARGLDRDGSVAAVIARRDIWSGVTLDWPVDGSDDWVAVDLAALPAFARDRAFEGYRGFGVIRAAENRRAAGAVEPSASVAAEPAAPVAELPAPPSNVVRLTRPAAPVDGERLSVPEQDAFRRIAAALGATPPPETHKPPSAEAETLIRDVPAASEPSAPASEAPQSLNDDLARLESASERLAVRIADIVSAVSDEGRAPPAPEVPAMSDDSAEALPVGEASGRAALADPADRLRDRMHEQHRADHQKIAELEAILDTATDGVIVVDREGRVERINRSAEALFGVDTASVSGRAFTDLLAEESRKSALDYLDGLARNGVASVLNDGREVIGRVPQSGGLIPLFMTMGRLAEADRFCAVLRDITQWKNAEEELINARRAAESASMQKSDFLAKVSHEIRTPLNAIIGFSEVMMEERFGPIGTERYKEYLRDIHISGAHLMSLLNDLLDLSKIEAGKLELTFEAVALNEVVMECVALMQPQANRERIIIRTSLSGQVPSVVADPRSIRQIVLNLVSNAVKFTLAGGQVIVSTAMEPQGEVTLRIRDTGIGMSEKDIETALKPFRQLTAASKPRNDGTGLGLPLTKALVEANRASFAIDSTVGQGTLIRITFPATRVLAS